MKATGIVRYVDKLGRITVPKELRDTQEITTETPMEILCDGDTIVLRKYAPGCAYCGKVSDDIVAVNGIRICRECANNMPVLFRRAGAVQKL